MNKGLSIREFARREQVSDTLVRRAIKQGRIKALADGKISESLVGSAWRKGTPAKPPKGANRVRTPRASANIKGANTQADHAGGVPDGESLEAAVERLITSGAVDLLQYSDALTLKENYIALTRKLEFEEKRKSLVSMEAAESALFEGARAARDAWLNWPVRVAPLIAADLGLEADRVAEVLTEHVHKHIGQLGEPDVSFGS